MNLLMSSQTSLRIITEKSLLVLVLFHYFPSPTPAFAEMRYIALPITLATFVLVNGIFAEDVPTVRKHAAYFQDGEEVSFADQLEARAGRWYQSRFVKGPISLFAGIATSDKAVYNQAYADCREFYDGKYGEKGLDCISGAWWTLFNLAAHTYTNYGLVTAFTAAGGMAAVGQVLNRYGQPQIRDVNGLLNPEQLAKAQAQLPADLSHLTLHAAMAGHPNIADSYTLHFHDDAAMYKHVTNGSHGFIQLQPHSNSGNVTKRDHQWSWKFGPKVAGIKMSYFSPCGMVLKDEKAANRPVWESVKAFSSWAQKHPSDRYTLELAETTANNDIFVATLIFEQNQFGTNYETWPAYQPAVGCANKKKFFDSPPDRDL